MDEIIAAWDGSHLVPLARYAKRCDAALVIGQRYSVDVALPRNMAAHRAYFAQIKELWLNLPEDVAADHASPEILRKHALCKTGYCTESQQVYSTNRDAIMASAWAMAGSDYVIAEVSGRVLRIWRPESQSVKAMGSVRFRESCGAVLDYLAGMVGVTREQLAEAGEAA